MSTLNLIFILLIIFLGIWVWTLKRKITQLEVAKTEALAQAGKGVAGINEKRTQEKNERKEKILQFVQEKGRATNDEIQTLLSVSDATATTYLDELEKSSQLRQVGKSGAGVYYEIN